MLGRLVVVVGLLEVVVDGLPVVVVPGRDVVVVVGRDDVLVPGRLVVVVLPGRLVVVVVPGRVEVVVEGRLVVVVPGLVVAVVPGRLVVVVVFGRVGIFVEGRLVVLVLGWELGAWVAGRAGAVVVCCPICCPDEGGRCCAGAGWLAGAELFLFLSLSCAHVSADTVSRTATRTHPEDTPVRRNLITTSGNFSKISPPRTLTALGFHNPRRPRRTRKFSFFRRLARRPWLVFRVVSWNNIHPAARGGRRPGFPERAPLHRSVHHPSL